VLLCCVDFCMLRISVDTFFEELSSFPILFLIRAVSLVLNTY